MLYFQIVLNRKHYNISAGVRVKPSQWLSKQRLAVISNTQSRLDNHNNKEANKRVEYIVKQLSELKCYLSDHIEDIPNAKALLLQYLGKAEKETTNAITNVTNMVKEIDQPKESGLKQLKSVLTKYYGNAKDAQSRLSMLTQFEAYCKANKYYTLEDICKRKVLNDFKTYINSNKCLAVSSVTKYVSYVYQLFEKCVNEGYITNSQYIDAKPTKDKDNTTKAQPFLYNDEVMRLYRYEVANDYERIIKDIFLFECVCGQRINDILSGKVQLVEKGTSAFFSVNTGKMQKLVRTKIYFKLALEIANKYKDASGYVIFPKSANNGDNDRLINNANINNAIKEIAKNAGLDREYQSFKHKFGNNKADEMKQPLYEVIHSHIGRHTFDSLLLLAGLSISEISKSVGHTEKEVLDYTAGVDDIARGHYDNTPDEDKVAYIEDEAKEANNLNELLAYDEVMNFVEMHKDGITLSKAQLNDLATKLIKPLQSGAKCTLSDEALATYRKGVFLIAYATDYNLVRQIDYKLKKLGLIDKVRTESEVLAEIDAYEDYDKDKVNLDYEPTDEDRINAYLEDEKNYYNTKGY